MKSGNVMHFGKGSGDEYRGRLVRVLSEGTCSLESCGVADRWRDGTSKMGVKRRELIRGARLKSSAEDNRAKILGSGNVRLSRFIPDNQVPHSRSIVCIRKDKRRVDRFHVLLSNLLRHNSFLLPFIFLLQLLPLVTGAIVHAQLVHALPAAASQYNSAHLGSIVAVASSVEVKASVDVEWVLHGSSSCRPMRQVFGERKGRKARRTRFDCSDSDNDRQTQLAGMRSRGSIIKLGATKKSSRSRQQRCANFRNHSSQPIHSGARILSSPSDENAPVWTLEKTSSVVSPESETRSNEEPRRSYEKFSKQIPTWMPSSQIGEADKDWKSSAPKDSVAVWQPYSLTAMCRLTWVRCSKGVVTSIDASNRGFQGPIPSCFSLLTGLQTLNLSHNSFSGTIPPMLGLLLNLTILDLSYNKLSGPIPETMGSLGKLSILDASHNQLQGPIPGTLSQMKALTAINLSSNRLSGPIPPNLCNLSNLSSLSLSFNNLRGSIPSDLGSFEKLEVLSLGGNEFTGPIPSELGDLPLLKVLDLRRNRLTGLIPFRFGSPKLLKVLDLHGNYLNGSIPDSLGSLSSLEELILSNNRLEGSLPSALGRLNSLKLLDVSRNQLVGRLPSQLSLLSQLKFLYVNRTSVSGSIPAFFGNLLSLQFLSLSSNNLDGSIPSSLGLLWSMEYLDLEGNNFTGPIPSALSNCIHLEYLLLSANSLSGGIPQSLANLPHLKVVAMGKNLLGGELPKWGMNTPFLEEIVLPLNTLSGNIPHEWGQLSFLQVVSLSVNNLTGSIPKSLQQCKGLQQMWLDHNALTGQLDDWLGQLPNLAVLSVINNRFSGGIPASLANCSLLETLYLGSNFLSGEIPAQLGQLPNLVVLSLSFNNLSGSIPPQLGNLTSLRGLDVTRNMLIGSLPRELVGLTSLQFLLLGLNNLTGTIPTWLSQLSKLQALDLSSNNFFGDIPTGLTNLSYFRTRVHSLPTQPMTRLERNNPGLDLMYTEAIIGQTFLLLGSNRLSGRLPDDFGDLKNLWVLDVHDNQLSGKIPANLGGADALCYLDLSDNLFSGDIPGDLENLSFLSFFNVSDNRLTGRIPDHGQFDTFGANSYRGNWGLCGLPLGTTCGVLPTIPSSQAANLSSTHGAGGTSGLHHIKLKTGALVGIAMASTIVGWGMLGLLLWWRIAHRCSTLNTVLAVHNTGVEHRPNPKEALSINVATFQNFLPKLTLADLMKATNNFAIENVLGDGGFGTVYKANLPDKTLVAVKRLMGNKMKGEREFLAEMETLGKIKHSNLVPLIGYCTFRSDRMLVYQYMPNGNLDLWLHTSARVSAGRKALDWPTRLKIAQGAARGLAFLHHICIPHIVHRDIKASNVLLDADFNALISDFGLARLISAYETHLSTDLAGTVGYIPPEYGQSPFASTKGDVYSFGMVLLEILTGKRPTDRFVKERDDCDFDFIGWVRHLVLQSRINEVFDPELVLELDPEYQSMGGRIAESDSDINPEFSSSSSEESSPDSSPDSRPGTSPVSSAQLTPKLNPMSKVSNTLYHEVSELNVKSACQISSSTLLKPGLNLVQGLSPRPSTSTVSNRPSASSVSNPRYSSVMYSPRSDPELSPDVDSTFRESGNKLELVQALGLAVWCTEEMASKRPTMLQISRLLDKMGENRNPVT